MGESARLLILFVLGASYFINRLPEWDAFLAKYSYGAIAVALGFLWLSHWSGWMLLLVGSAELFWIYQQGQRDREPTSLIGAAVDKLPGLIVTFFGIPLLFVTAYICTRLFDPTVQHWRPVAKSLGTLVLRFCKGSTI